MSMYPDYGKNDSVLDRNGAEVCEMLTANYNSGNFEFSTNGTAFGTCAWQDNQRAYSERMRDDEVMIVPMRRMERGQGASVIVDNEMYNAASSVFTRSTSRHVSNMHVSGSEAITVADESPPDIPCSAAEFSTSDMSSNISYASSVASCGGGEKRAGSVSGYSASITAGYLCPICGDVSSGHHYGIDCCESCKGFFRRVVQQKQSYQCKFSGNCEITKETRRNCAACRYHRCVQLGMLTTSVRENRKRGGCKRRKIDNGRNLDTSKHAQKQHANLPTGALGQRSTHQDSNNSPLTESNTIVSRGPISLDANSPNNLSILNRKCLDAYIRFLSPCKLMPASEASDLLSPESELNPCNSFVTSHGWIVTTFNNLPYTDCNILWAENVVESCFPMISEAARLACLLHNWSPICLFDYLIVKSYEFSSQRSSSTAARYPPSTSTCLFGEPMVTKTLQLRGSDRRVPNSDDVLAPPSVVHKEMRFNQLTASGLKFCNLISEVESAELDNSSRSSSPLLQEISALSVIAERLDRLSLNVAEVSLCRVLIMLSTCMNTDASENPSDLSKISDCQLMAMNELEQYCEQRIKSLSLPNSHSQESATRNENLAVDGATRTAIANPFDQSPYLSSESSYIRNSTKDISISGQDAFYSTLTADNSHNAFHFYNRNQGASHSNQSISSSQCTTLPDNSKLNQVQMNSNLALESTGGPIVTLQTANSPIKFPQFENFDDFVTREKLICPEVILKVTPPEERFNEICLLLFDIERFVADNLGSVGSNDVFSILMSTSSKPEQIKETYRRILNESKIVKL
ncbi:uncharacterized protein LOC142348187 isoform X2 [Convolutriloba macropyga]|uniref:uncharacterized protein LOC142348187 isoform X2 n=1 Tax=Convolutriloba macropyga TaxID=536237 RepID=UPI003F51C5DE